MPLLHIIDNDFQSKLEQSLIIVQNRSVKDYWLNQDGSISPKTSWLGRIIRWFCNLFFDKTISDIWDVFSRALEEFEATRTSTIDKKGHFVSPQEGGMVLGRARRLNLAIKFLYSRKETLDRWIKKDPVKLEFIKTQIDRYKKAIKNSGTSQQDLSKSHRENLEKIVHSLESVYLPKINEGTLDKRPSPLKPSISPEINLSKYEEICIEGLLTKFHELPLSKKESEDFKALLACVENGVFQTTFWKVINSKEFPILHFDIEHPPAVKPFKAKHNFLLIDSLHTSIKNYLLKASVSKEDSEERASIILEDICKNMPNKTNFSKLFYQYRQSKNLANLIESVKLRDPQVFGVNAKIYTKYYDQIELYLKNILYECDHNAGVSNDKIRSVLNELAIAGGLCGARWIEESKKQYKSVKSKGDATAEILVLEHIQALKEDIFLEIFQNSSVKMEFHILDSFRKAYGASLGLDDSTTDLDVFTYKLSKKSLTRLRNIFLTEYNSKRLIAGIKERINTTLQYSFEPAYFSYLAEKVDARFPSVKDTSEYVMKHFMKNQCQSINKAGVRFLLEEMNILTH